MDATEEHKNEEECVADANHEQVDPDRNTADPLGNIGMDIINDPVSQLDETTGVDTVDDTDDNLQSDVYQRYG